MVTHFSELLPKDDRPFRKPSITLSSRSSTLDDCGGKGSEGSSVRKKTPYWRNGFSPAIRYFELFTSCDERIEIPGENPR